MAGVVLYVVQTGPRGDLMLPPELPLSLARALVPAPPAMAQETRKAVDVHQSRTLMPWSRPR